MAGLLLRGDPAIDLLLQQRQRQRAFTQHDSWNFGRLNLSPSAAFRALAQF
jgi:hypothetical protein